MTTKRLLQLYESLFNTWRFQVNSHWQRSSYFAAFETVAIGACWKLLSERSWAAIVLAVLGLGLTGVWFLNNNKTHFYARYWLNALCDVERRLIGRSHEQGIDFATKILNRERGHLIRHPYLVQAVPAIFCTAWLFLFGFGLYLRVIKSEHMSQMMRPGLFSLLIATASLAVSLTSAFIAKASLSQAKLRAARDQREWRERKWIDNISKS